MPQTETDPRLEGEVHIPGTNRTRLDACRPGFMDKVYKVEHGVEIPVRIWAATKPSGEKVPWVFWIHGGGFQSGNAYTPDPWIHPAFGEKYHIVSVAYRYIPQVGISEEVEDCIDAFEWCRQNLPSLLPNIDLEQYISAGDSAGGCLATLMGHHLSPKPKVIIDIYGVVDMLNPNYYKKWDGAIDLSGREGLKDKLEEASEDRDLSRAQHSRLARYHLTLPIDKMRSIWGLSESELKDDKEEYLFQCDLYDHMSKVGKRFTSLLRLDDLPTQEERDQRCKDFSAYHFLEKTGKEYPPTYIIHGTGDVLVLVEESYAFEKKLKELGVDVESYYPEGEPHAFDQRINGPENKEDWDKVVVPALNFVGKYIQA